MTSTYDGYKQEDRYNSEWTISVNLEELCMLHESCMSTLVADPIKEEQI